MIVVDPAYLRGGAIVAGIGLLTGAFLLGRATRAVNSKAAMR
jgi:hypothetical protein